MSGQQLKYVRTDAGFATCPSMSGLNQHLQLATTGPRTPISAGFIDFDFDDLPFCHGRSESLNLNSMACDTAALRKAWSHRAGTVAPALNPTALADAKKFAEGLSDAYLEHGNPPL